MRRLWSGPVNSASARTVTAPVAPSMRSMTFCVIVGPRPEELAGRAVERVDEPRLARNAGHDAALLRRVRKRGLIHGTSLASGATAVSTKMRSNG